MVSVKCVLTIGVDLAGILRGTHGEHRRWVGTEWDGVWDCLLYTSDAADE